MAIGHRKWQARQGLTQPDEVRVFEVSTAGFSVQQLRFRDLLDIAEVTGLDVLDLSPILSGIKGKGADKIKALAAFTWIVYRRTEPDLTYDEVLNGRIKVTDNSKPDPTLPEPQI